MPRADLGGFGRFASTLAPTREIERFARTAHVKKTAPLIALLITANPALAQPYQPSLACRAADTNMALDLYLPLAKDGSGNVARGMRGELAIHHQKMPLNRRRFALDDKLPAQFWNVGNDLKIRLLLGTDDDLLDLVIEVQRNSQNTDNGVFRLVTAEGVKVQGRIGCVVD